ncbi:hypothetical protein MKK63_02760 [Methylobacterium sp. J-088]|uniref:hypothetical protein n=1 Tax=Methylobacterium sp. J-088 TaxID=2836664 RepID=UPI001FB8DF99|nr:hypothetical protein [Methylobacterium sp. J-088]MCJ2061633.1 hypothetical protein [Methylobacterium sp. J-088]
MRAYSRAIALSDFDPSAFVQRDPDRRTAFLKLEPARRRQPADLLNDAVDAFLELDFRQRAGIEAGLLEAEAGAISSADEAAAAFRPRWSSTSRAAHYSIWKRCTPISISMTRVLATASLPASVNRSKA